MNGARFNGAKQQRLALCGDQPQFAVRCRTSGIGLGRPRVTRRMGVIIAQQFEPPLSSRSAVRRDQCHGVNLESRERVGRDIGRGVGAQHAVATPAQQPAFLVGRAKHAIIVRTDPGQAHEIGQQCA